MAGQAPPPVFVVGCPRSGTTLLQAMLSSHPDLAIPPESHFIPSLWRVRARYARGGGVDAERLARDAMSTLRFREWDLPEEAVLAGVADLRDPSFEEAVAAIFLAYARARGKSRWGDKTPGYSLDLPLLAEALPSARFVHLIRDGRDVAPSLLEMPWGPRSLAEAAFVWRYRVRRGRAGGRAAGPERYREVRYEALVEDPGAVLAGVSSFVGLDLRPEMLDPASRRDEVVPERTRGQHRSLERPPTAGIRDWRRDLSPADVDRIEAVAGDLLEELGYERSARPRSPGGRAAGLAAVARGQVRAALWRVRHLVLGRARGRIPPSRRW
ncbi:MAG: sulfotransferase [Actinobacteria bacterium]|nr:sulfotransferase [Actinomycetota bacterium]